MAEKTIGKTQSKSNEAVKDLWAVASKKLLENDGKSKRRITGFAEEGTGPTRNFIFIGEKSVGKSSLIAKFLDESVSDEVLPTTALDFTHGSKSRDEKKVKITAYELGGGRTQAHMLSAALNEGNIAHTTVCLAVDLSKPGNSVDSVLFWLNSVREQSQKALVAL